MDEPVSGISQNILDRILNIIEDLPNKDKTVDIRLGGTLLNFIGWDGLVDIDLEFFPNFYANINRPFSLSNIKGIEIISENVTLDDSLHGDDVFTSMNAESDIIPTFAPNDNIFKRLDLGRYNKCSHSFSPGCNSSQ